MYAFAFFKLVCVQSVIQLMNTHLSLSISFSRVIVVQDFETETVTFLCVICIQADLLCYFRFKSVQ